MTTNEPDFLNYKKNAELQFEAIGEYEIPVVKGIRFKTLSEPDMIGFNYVMNPNVKDKKSKILHFFLADYRFEYIWNNPDKYTPYLQQYKAICMPDFSMYTNMPKAMKIWQHYRRMWLSRYYQEQGIRVIPTPCWADDESFEYCFDGMPSNSCMCISSVGCVQNPKVRSQFLKGIQQVVDRLSPCQVILYGKEPKEFRDIYGGELVQVASDMDKRILSFRERRGNT